MNSIEQTLLWFQEQSLSRQVSLVGGIVLIASLTTYLVIWAISPSYGVLFSHLDSRDANPILTQLEEANIAYQVRNHGQDIYIDKALIDKTRIKLMGSPLQLAHSVGFELFDKTDFGMTDFSQKINYQRALQGELERTINSLDEIQQARVQLTIPEHHLFQQDNNAPRAAVTLHLNRPLTAQQINSIRQLITASVANLSPADVVMVDQNSNGLITNEDDAPASHFSAKKKVERYLNGKVMQMLHPIFESEAVMVKIDVTLNYDEFQRERVKPQSEGIITHVKETRHSSAPKTDKTPVNQDYTREKSYQLGREKEQFTRAIGAIERLTISVIVPQHTSVKKMQQIERLVKSVVGFNPKRGDAISIEALVTEPTFALEPVAMITPTASFSKHQLTGGFAGLAGLCSIAGFLRLRARMRRRHVLLAELNAWLSEHD